MRILLLALLASALTLPASPATRHDPPSGLQAVYRSLTEAWEALSADRVLQLYAPDARQEDGRGLVLDRAGIEANVREALTGAVACKVQYEVVDWQEKDGLMVLTVHQTRNLDDGTKCVWRVLDRQDSWRKTSEGWRLQYTRYLKQTATITTVGTPTPRPPHR